MCKLESFKCRNNVGMSLKQKPGHGKLAVLTGSDELDIHDVIIRSPSVSLGVVVSVLSATEAPSSRSHLAHCVQVEGHIQRFL